MMVRRSHEVGHGLRKIMDSKSVRTFLHSGRRFLRVLCLVAPAVDLEKHLLNLHFLR